VCAREKLSSLYKNHTEDMGIVQGKGGETSVLPASSSFSQRMAFLIRKEEESFQITEHIEPVSLL
jgi:hypothetical protein